MQNYPAVRLISTGLDGQKIDETTCKLPNLCSVGENHPCPKWMSVQPYTLPSVLLPLTQMYELALLGSDGGVRVGRRGGGMGGALKV